MFLVFRGNKGIVLKCEPRVEMFWNSAEYWEVATTEAKDSSRVLATWAESEIMRLS